MTPSVTSVMPAPVYSTIGEMYKSVEKGSVTEGYDLTTAGGLFISEGCVSNSGVNTSCHHRHNCPTVAASSFHILILCLYEMTSVTVNVLDRLACRLTDWPTGWLWSIQYPFYITMRFTLSSPTWFKQLRNCSCVTWLGSVV